MGKEDGGGRREVSPCSPTRLNPRVYERKAWQTTWEGNGKKRVKKNSREQ